MKKTRFQETANFSFESPIYLSGTMRVSLPNQTCLFRAALLIVFLCKGLIFAPFCTAQSNFVLTGSMSSARDYQTATLLPNGEVLVAGGYNNGYLASAELYNPTTGVWITTGSMGTARQQHTATLLQNGKVLVAGGWTAGGSTASAELYDPVAGSWAVTGSLNVQRSFHTATLLPSGQVLVAGGYVTSGVTPGGELYDPSSGTWTPIGFAANNFMTYGRSGHTATLLPNGKVLVAGGVGSGSTSLASAELYDPATSTWAVTGTLSTGRNSHTASLLLNGTVLVAGGQINGDGGNGTQTISSSEVYTPATGQWVVSGSLTTTRANHTATLLPNGKVLVAGGGVGGNGWAFNNIIASAEVYDQTSGTWSPTGSLTFGRVADTATLLSNGVVLIAGGWASNGSPLGSAEISALVPSVTTGTASGVYYNSAILNGIVNPNGEDAAAYFEIGLTGTYGDQTALWQLGNSTDPETLSAAVTGLIPNKTYHFRITATNAQAQNHGEDQTFTTPAVTPTYVPNPAQNVTSGSVALSGSVNPGGENTAVYFLYGTSTNYGGQTTAVELGNGTSSLDVSAPLSNLQPGTVYHFQIVITNTDGVTKGSDQMFSTPALSQTTTLHALKGDPADGAPGTTFASFGAPIVNTSDRVAFTGLLQSGTTKVTTADDSGIWADDSNGVRQLIARSGASAPGIPGAVFAKFSDPVYDDYEEVAFRGLLKVGMAGVKPTNEYGIWFNMGGTVQLAVRQDQQAAGCQTGVVYSNFTAFALTDAGIVFSATLTGPRGTGVGAKNNKAIWSISSRDGETRLIVRTGDTVTVENSPKIIKTLTVFPVLPLVAGQSRSAVGDVESTISYLATFADGTSAVLSTVIQ